MTWHKGTDLDYIHQLTNWQVADETARLALSLVSEYEGSVDV
jgi:hypothetical protein